MHYFLIDHQDRMYKGGGVIGSPGCWIRYSNARTLSTSEKHLSFVLYSKRDKRWFYVFPEKRVNFTVNKNC